MRPMPGRRSGGAREEGSFLGTVRSGGSVAAAPAAEGLAGPSDFPDFYEMKIKPSGFVTGARIDKAAYAYIQPDGQPANRSSSTGTRPLASDSFATEWAGLTSCKSHSRR